MTFRKPDESNVFQVGTAYYTGADKVLGYNGKANAQLIIVSMTLVNTSSGTTPWGAITLFDGVTRQIVHAGQVGAGFPDTFPWNGHLAMKQGDQLRLTASGGAWYATATGYWAPDHAGYLP